MAPEAPPEEEPKPEPEQRAEPDEEAEIKATDTVQTFDWVYENGPRAGPDVGSVNHVTEGVTRKESPSGWMPETLPVNGPANATVTVSPAWTVNEA